MSPITDIDPYVFLNLITSRPFQNTIHIVIADDAKFPDFGLNQEIKLRGQSRGRYELPEKAPPPTA